MGLSNAGHVKGSCDGRDLPGIVITGASGRMGRMLIDTVLASDKARLVGASSGRDMTGSDRTSGTAMGGAPLGVMVTDDPLEAFAAAQAVIDFTTPEATVDFAALAAQARAVHVIGTTGLGAGASGADRAGGTPCGDRAGGQHEPWRQPAGAADEAWWPRRWMRTGTSRSSRPITA